MVFFKSMVKAFYWSVLVAFAALLLSLLGVTVFSPALNSYVGFFLFYCLAIAFVLWKDY